MRGASGRTLFVASGRCGSTRWSADDPFGSGIRRFARDRHPKLDGGRGSKPSEGRCRERERVTCCYPLRASSSSWEPALVASSGLTRRLARQEARNAECGPSSSAAARLWMPDVEKLGRARPGSTLFEDQTDDLGIWESWGAVGCGSWRTRSMLLLVLLVSRISDARVLLLLLLLL